MRRSRARTRTGAVPGRAARCRGGRARCRMRCGADLGSQRLRAEWGQSPARYSWIRVMAMEPSPSASNWLSISSVPASWRRIWTHGHKGGAPPPPPCRGPRARIPPLAGQSSDLLGEPGLPDPAHRSAAGPLPGTYPSRPGGPSPSPAETLAPAAGGRRATTQEPSPSTVGASRCGTPSSVHASCPGAIRHMSPGLTSPSLPSSWVTRRRPATT